MNNWISVAEKLPDGNGKIYEGCLEESSLVLIYGIAPDKKQAFGIGRYVIDHNSPNDSGWTGYMDADWDLDHCNVTHWRPLPKIPKEVE